MVSENVRSNDTVNAGAHVLLPAQAWGEKSGTVTNSERRISRQRAFLDPPGEARDDLEIICDLANRLGHDWGAPTAEEVWDELRSLSSWHAGMSYARLEALGGLHWPCPSEEHPGSVILHDASHPPYAEAARANYERITVLCPPNAQGKRGLWLLDDPCEFTV